MKYRLIDTEDSLSDFVVELKGAERYAIDTEFQRERTYYPMPGLIQIAVDSGPVALIDPKACDVKALASVFDSDIRAVGHAFDQDTEVLKHWCGVAPRNVFDTQVAAGFLGFSSPSLATLLSVRLDVEVKKTDRLTDWVQRPLTESQLVYAAGDVEYLCALADAISADLNQRSRLEWAEYECANARTSSSLEGDPEVAWWKLKESRQLRGRSRIIAQKLAAWREERARAQNTPPRFILPDLAIAIIAQQPPKSESALRDIRTIDGRHLKGGAASEILQVVEQASELPDSVLRLPSYDPVDKSSRAISTLVAAWIGQLSKELEIDATLMATRSDIDAYLNDRDSSRLSKGWRNELIGTKLSKLVSGEAAIAFKENGELVLEERSKKPL